MKDASSIAIYGSRGANGVIIINTKQGMVGKPKVNYTAITIPCKPNPPLPKMMQFLRICKVTTGDRIERRFITCTIRLLKCTLDNGVTQRTLESYKNDKGYDWPAILMSDAPMHNHSLSINGGSTDI